MSNPSPTLLRLFTRSRYISRRTRTEDDTSEQAEKERTERERWIVAALGHVLTHDERFREQFWKLVCCEDQSETPDNITVVVEPESSADLLLTASWKDKRTTACVVEAKTGAKLADHQNPDNCKFIDQSKGYGTALQNNYANTQTQLRYVVLGHRDQLRRLGPNPWNAHPPIGILQRSWSTVADITPTSALVQDLFDTLAGIGPSEFAMKKLDNINITKGLEAAQAWAIIEGICDRLDIRGEKRRLESHYISPNDFHFGAYIKSSPRGTRSNVHEQLVKLTKCPHQGNLAWFGYEADGKGKLQRSVWLYTDTLATAKLIAQSFGATAKGDCEADRENTPYVKITGSVGSAPSDVRFFLDVFKKLVTTAKLD